MVMGGTLAGFQIRSGLIGYRPVSGLGGAGCDGLGRAMRSMKASGG